METIKDLYKRRLDHCAGYGVPMGPSRLELGNSVPNSRPSTKKTIKRTMFMASDA
jgi:hypothetical protein